MSNDHILEAITNVNDLPLDLLESTAGWSNRRNVGMVIGSEGRLTSILVFTDDTKDFNSARLIRSFLRLF
jgi:hypothetical protein